MPAEAQDDEIPVLMFAFGAAHVDVILRTKGVPVEYDTIPAKGSKSFGGVAYNVASILGKLGMSIGIMTVSGGDSVSGLIDKNLQQQNIKPTIFIPVSESETASYTAIHGPDGTISSSVIDNEIYHNLTVKTLSQYIPQIRSAQILICDSSFKSPVYEYLADVLIEENIEHYVVVGSLSEVGQITPLLKRCKGLFGNVTEMNALANNMEHNEDNIEKSLLSLYEHYGVESIFATNGDKGVYALCKGQRYFFKTKVVERVVCGNGAGNAFAAGVLYGILNNKQISKSIEFGLAMSLLKLEGKEISLENLNHAVLEVEEHNASTVNKLLFNTI